MKRLTSRICLALITLAMPGLAAPVAAQQPSKTVVPFKLTSSGVTEAFVIPVSPPLLSVKISGRGQSDLLGAFTETGHDFLHLGIDGVPHSATDGVAVFTGANDDAVFVRFSGLIRPAASPGTVSFEGAFTVTGGRGRFLGADGSGTIRGEVNDKGAFTISYDGSVSFRKP
jgi:hypothetical protein